MLFTESNALKLYGNNIGLFQAENNLLNELEGVSVCLLNFEKKNDLIFTPYPSKTTSNVLPKQFINAPSTRWFFQQLEATQANSSHFGLHHFGKYVTQHSKTVVTFQASFVCQSFVDRRDHFLFCWIKILRYFCRYIVLSWVEMQWGQREPEFQKFRWTCKSAACVSGLVAVVGRIRLWIGRRLGAASEADWSRLEGGKNIVNFSKFNKQTETRSINNYSVFSQNSVCKRKMHSLTQNISLHKKLLSRVQYSLALLLLSQKLFSLLKQSFCAFTVCDKVHSKLIQRQQK